MGETINLPTPEQMGLAMPDSDAYREQALLQMYVDAETGELCDVPSFEAGAEQLDYNQGSDYSWHCLRIVAQERRQLSTAEQEYLNAQLRRLTRDIEVLRGMEYFAPFPDAPFTTEPSEATHVCFRPLP